MPKTSPSSNPALAAAWQKGHAAGFEGKDKSACPYGDRARAFIRAWTRGWKAGRRSAKLALLPAEAPETTLPAQDAQAGAIQASTLSHHAGAAPVAAEALPGRAESLSDELDAVSRIHHPKKRAFLSAYSRMGVIRGAAQAAGVSRGSHGNWIKDDPDYAVAFAQADEDAADLMEQEAIRRAIVGVEKLVLYQGQPVLVPDPRDPEPDPDKRRKVMLVEKMYSDLLLIFMLKAKRPEKFRERFEHTGAGGGPIRVEDPLTQALLSVWEEIKAMRAGDGRGSVPALPAAKG